MTQMGQTMTLRPRMQAALTVAALVAGHGDGIDATRRAAANGRQGALSRVVDIRRRCYTE